MLHGSKNSWKHFLLLVVEAFSLQNVVVMLEEVVGERWGEYAAWGKTSQTNSFNFSSAGCAKCSQVLSCRRTGLILLHFSVRLIYLLSILLRCNGFIKIQKAVVDQMGSRPPNSEHDLFLVQVFFGKCFRASSWSNPWVGHHWLSYTIHFLLHITIWSRNVHCYCID